MHKTRHRDRETIRSNIWNVIPSFIFLIHRVFWSGAFCLGGKRAFNGRLVIVGFSINCLKRRRSFRGDRLHAISILRIPAIDWIAINKRLQVLMMLTTRKTGTTKKSLVDGWMDCGVEFVWLGTKIRYKKCRNLWSADDDQWRRGGKRKILWSIIKWNINIWHFTQLTLFVPHLKWSTVGKGNFLEELTWAFLVYPTYYITYFRAYSYHRRFSINTKSILESGDK